MQAQDLMSRTVVTVRPHMPIEAAAALLVSRGVTSAPVVTAEGVLRGVVSEVDLLRAQLVPESPTTTPESGVTAADVMTPSRSRCGLPMSWPTSRRFCSTTVSAQRPSSRTNGSSASSAATTSCATSHDSDR